jgi:inactivated superfamily I helicase
MTDPLLARLRDAAESERQRKFDRFVLEAFRRKYDTVEIAKLLKHPEAEVANRLARVRDAERAA